MPDSRARRTIQAKVKYLAQVSDSAPREPLFTHSVKFQSCQAGRQNRVPDIYGRNVRKESFGGVPKEGGWGVCALYSEKRRNALREREREIG
jgi:hypothetical protein